MFEQVRLSFSQLPQRSCSHIGGDDWTQECYLTGRSSEHTHHACRRAPLTLAGGGGPWTLLKQNADTK